MGSIFEWDLSTAESNYKNFKISFSDAASVFSDDRALTINENRLEAQKYVIIGSTETADVLTVVFNWHSHAFQIISARKATQFEMLAYQAAYET